jgi:hypothetical protein
MMHALNAERARELLRYDPVSGFVYWKVDVRGSSGRKADDRAGTLANSGYRRIGIDGEVYLEHRIIWLIVTGKWPSECLDHINNVKDDNRFCNLREASQSQNGANKPARSVYGKGVYFRRGKYFAVISYDGRPKYLGTFDNLNEAKQVYANAAAARFGEFARF